MGVKIRKTDKKLYLFTLIIYVFYEFKIQGSGRCFKRSNFSLFEKNIVLLEIIYETVSAILMVK